ncbi:MAG: protein translocase subunit SecDF, partial [Verrucomicrobiota bacterium]
MNASVLWKLLVSAAIVAWALLNLLPMEDTDFDVYLETVETNDPAAFTAFLERAQAMAEAENIPLNLALRQTANAERLDLHGTFFADRINLVETKNLTKRNDILVRVLYDHSRGKLRKGLDLAGGVGLTLKLKDEAENAADAEARLNEAVEVMQRRVDGLGVAEPVIRPVPPNALEIQLPGLDLEQNPDALDTFKKPARLEFKLVHRDALPGPGVQTPLGYVAMEMEEEDDEGNPVVRSLFIKRKAEATGDIVSRAFPTMNTAGGYEVGINMTSEGGDRFYQMTKAVDDEDRRRGDKGRIALVLDGELQSAFGLAEGAIAGGSAQITGQFTQLEAQELSNVLNNPLKYELEVGELYVVSPTLAEDARDASVNAALLGAGLVILFMIGYYLVAGLVSMISVSLAITVVLGVLMSVGGTLTLPGVAALVLTIGMAVDANILIF